MAAAAELRKGRAALNPLPDACIVAPMGSRTLLLLLVALMVFAAPMLTARAAHAAVPAQPLSMMDSGHCPSMPLNGHHKAPAKSCCVAICAAVAITAIATLGEPAAIAVPGGLSVPRLDPGFLGDIATPPPRGG